VTSRAAYAKKGVAVFVSAFNRTTTARLVCPPHHHDKHPEHHDEDYRRALRAELEEFETWLAELQQRKDKSEEAV
jgi:hypothetical protein